MHYYNDTALQDNELWARGSEREKQRMYNWLNHGKCEMRSKYFNRNSFSFWEERKKNRKSNIDGFIRMQVCKYIKYTFRLFDVCRYVCRFVHFFFEWTFFPGSCYCSASVCVCVRFFFAEGITNHGWGADAREKRGWNWKKKTFTDQTTKYTPNSIEKKTKRAKEESKQEITNKTELCFFIWNMPFMYSYSYSYF